MIIKLMTITPDAEKHIEQCARTCYDSFDKMREEVNGAFLKGLLKSGHLSVFEHASASFNVEDISRACSHQLVRHRTLSFSQQSQRYCEDEGGCFTMPTSIAADDGATMAYYRAMDFAYSTYNKLIMNGVPKEDARYVLPNAAPTRIVVSGNMSAWIQFLSKRLDKRAQLEIRMLAVGICELLNGKCPNIFGDLWETAKAIDTPKVFPTGLPRKFEVI